jgi:16S rRNA A1518/A1519 N6-dimethyltransferase RsmA/KsgA/DIM1 with predicted DNA glycosylase/AP lyase activity
MDTVSMPYVGAELELFARAANWKAYLARQIRPFLAGDVLEVGAGMGANTALFLTPAVRRWTCLEPDGRLASRIDRQSDSRVAIRLARGRTVRHSIGPVGERQVQRDHVYRRA